MAVTTSAEGEDQQPSPSIKRISKWKALLSITFNFLLVVGPMVALSIVFLCLIYFNRLLRTAGTDLNIFPQDKIDDTSYYYVDISAATLVYVASWSSTLASTLTGCVVPLLSYSIAAVLQRRPDRGKLSLAQAPQIVLLVQLFAGQRFKVLRRWLSLTFQKHNADIITHFAGVGLTVLLLMVTVNIAADAYLHLSTESVTYVAARPWGDNQDVLGSSWGLDTTTCLHNNNTYNSQLGGFPDSCILYPCGDDGVCWTGGDPSVIHNESSSISTYLYAPPDDDPNDNSNISLAAHFSYAYVGDTFIDSDFDFAATTYAVSTQCEIVTPQCQTNASFMTEVAAFDCGPAYPAFKLSNLTAGSDVFYFFTDPSATVEGRDHLVNGSDPSRADLNMFTWGIASAANQEAQFSAPSVNITLSTLFGEYELFFLMCNTSVWDAAYTFYNNSVVPESWTITPANASVTNMVQLWIFLDFALAAATEALAESTQNPAVHNVKSAITLFGTRMSALTLAVATAGMTTYDPVTAQVRSEKIVSKVHKAAVACFVGANLLMVLLAGLTFIAALTALVAGGQEVRDIVEQLSIRGIVLPIPLDQAPPRHPTQTWTYPDPHTPPSGIESLESSFFRLTVQQTATGTKFLLFTDPSMSTVSTEAIMRGVYERYADHVCKNPFWQMEMPIRLEGWDREIAKWLAVRRG
ncbi:hypothetical protein DV736_g2112, partial [Chaetothyriales sp. CBS 134916]